MFASFLAALSRGGLMFMLIIWLQGIWLPLHGYDFADTPLWAGLAMLPLTAGFLVAGPISGILSDRYGARPFATGGMIGTAVVFVLLELLPIDFPYWLFAVLLFFTGLTMALFGSPNRAGVMNSLPPEHRGAGSGMNTTFQNSAQVLSIGIFFTLMIAGLSASLPASLYHGLVAHGVSTADATRVSHLPPVSTLFAAFLGYNPVQHLVGAARAGAASGGPASGSHRSQLLPRPHQPRRSAAGLHAALDFAIVASLVAAAASWTRGTTSTTRWRSRMTLRRRRARTTEAPPSRADGRDSRTMTSRRTSTGERPVVWRIGEVAKLTGVTTRTLRYWEELELAPADRPRKERRRGLLACRPGTSEPDPRPSGPARVFTRRGQRRTRVRGGRRARPRALRAEGWRSSRRDERVLLDEAIAANDQLLARLADTVVPHSGVPRRTGRDRRSASANRAPRSKRTRADASPPVDGKTPGMATRPPSSPELTPART